MSKFYPKIFLLTLLTSISLFGFSFAEDPDTFVVNVEPSSFSVGESVDMTITAFKNWMVVKDYIWDVFIEVTWLMPDDYIVPSNWLYSFLIQDQWVKLFSKWLEIKRAGTYKVRVSDIIDESVLWETTIIVWSPHWAWSLKTINITSPINSSTEKRSAINIIWSSFDLRNSPIQIYLNNMLAAQGNTDSMWNFNVYISELKPWENKIQAKITDISDILLWESNILTINYESPADGIFNSIEVLPSGEIKQWDKLIFNVYTIEDVTSAELKFSDQTTYPLDRISPWVFKKEMIMTQKWSIDLSVSLMAWWIQKTYENVAAIFVKENSSVSNIRFVSTWVDGTSLYIYWDTIWESSRYRIKYGTNRNDLQKTLDVNSNQILVENIQTNTIYYFQILPLDEWLHASWEPSDIVEYDPEKSYASCIVKWVKIVSEKIWDKYFLVWDEVENVVKYEIYRSDWEDMSDMKKVWETTWTRFEYYFDKYSEKDQYAYYQVEAICGDWSTVTIDEAQKIQVWPFENTLLILVITFFVYSIYRLYNTIEH